MATLLERCKEIHAGLERARLANQIRHEATALASREAEWKERKDKRQRQATQLQLLSLSQGDQSDLDSANATVRSIVAEASKRLSSEGVDALSRDNLWVTLLQAANAANAKADAGLQRAWQHHVAALGDTPSPEQLERTVPRTPANAEALADYRRAYPEYLRHTRSVPVESSGLAHIEAAARTLRDIRSRLTTSAPEDVRRFLAAADGGGAPLALLTESVRQWLEQHDDVSRFVIKPKSNIR